MKKAKKIVALLLCAVLLICASVAGTLAYLTQQTKTVTNTFTVGKVSLGTDTNGDGLIDNGLDEAKVDEYGKIVFKTDAEGNPTQEPVARVTENTYKLIPGHTYVKDPTIHVAAGSEECYLFVKVENGISAIEAEGDTIAQQMKANNWEELTGVSNTYYYKTTVSTLDKNGVTDIKVFESFTIGNDKDVSGSAGKTIEVTAYAVQADGFNSAADAWSKTFGKSTTNP